MKKPNPKRSAIDGLRLATAGGTVPPPLVDSPKCPLCPLVGMPDEVNFLKREATPPRPHSRSTARRHVASPASVC